MEAPVLSPVARGVPYCQVFKKSVTFPTRVRDWGLSFTVNTDTVFSERWDDRKKNGIILKCNAS